MKLWIELRVSSCGNHFAKMNHKAPFLIYWLPSSTLKNILHPNLGIYDADTIESCGKMHGHSEKGD